MQRDLGSPEVGCGFSCKRGEGRSPPAPGVGTAANLTDQGQRRTLKFTITTERRLDHDLADFWKSMEMCDCQRRTASKTGGELRRQKGWFPDTGIPTTPSNHALAWHCLRLAGVTDVLSRFGRLLEL